MIRRTLAVLLASFVLPIAAGTAIETTVPPSLSHGVTESADLKTFQGDDRAVAYAATQGRVQNGEPVRNGVAVAEPAGTSAAQSGVCPADMVAVEGVYCTEVRQDCKRWLDDESLQYARCAEYEKPSRCTGKRVQMRFCIDRYEYTAPGEKLPMNHASFMIASKVCKELGKRICTEDEWTFACEGEEMRPYPYGFSREPKCNQDREEDLFIQTPKERLLKDHREPSDARPDCVSPFGVYNMVGNVDEPVFREVARYNYPFRNALKGGWWMPARNRCRPATTAHDDYYEDVQVGVRCCADAPGAASQPAG